MTIVTLTSDLGCTDYYAGAVKGSILKESPNVQIIDISQEVPSHDIVQGAFILKNAYHHFPTGSIHLISVHNNYNYQNSYVLFEQDGYFFVGPNNGLFSLIFENMPSDVYEIGKEIKGALPVAEIFRKAVKQIVAGDTLNEIGDPVQNLVLRMNLQPVVTRSNIRGSVIHVDKFDNLILNITKEIFEKARKNRDFALYFKRFDPITKICDHYFDVPVGETLCLFNSSGHLEISINMGKAASLLGVKVEETVQIDFYDEP